MITEQERLHLRHAVSGIEDAIAGIKGVKSSMGMTEQSHMEKDLIAAIVSILKVTNPVDMRK